VQPTFPIRATFYYPWFPETWGDGTVYNPILGRYDSSDTTVISSHIADMRYAGMDAAIASWWGQGTRTDQRFPLLLQTNGSGPLRWTIYYEKEGYSNPSISTIANDLSYISTKYGSDKSYLRVSGKPVIFVYADGSDNCGMADRWDAANNGRFYVVLKVFSGYRNCATQPSSWHQYAPAIAADSQLPYSYSVSPGFWKYGESSPRLIRDTGRFSENIKSMIASNAKWQLITTFNEWGEGTAIERASEWHKEYLNILANDGIIVSPTVSMGQLTVSRAALPAEKYVFIWMENKEYTSITASAAPYMTSFAANGRYFSNFWGVTHPSLPNYLAFASGGTQGKSGTNDISAGEINANNIWNQLQRAKIPWKVYQEDMPSACYSGSSSGDYVLRHNPAIPFANVFFKPKCKRVVPLSALDVTNLPQISFITPNLCNDMHDCSVTTGDTWLSKLVPQLLGAGVNVFISFDEGSTSTNGGGHIWTAMDGPNISTSTNSTFFNHYSVLAALEDMFGRKRLGSAASATPVPLT
jgi:hypothetical protein